MTTQETEGKGGDQGDLNAEGKRILDAYRILFDFFKLQNDNYFKRIQILMVVIQVALFTAAFKFVSVTSESWDEVKVVTLVGIAIIGIVSAWYWSLLNTKQNQYLEFSRSMLRNLESRLVELGVPLRYFTLEAHVFGPARKEIISSAGTSVRTEDERHIATFEWSKEEYPGEGGIHALRRVSGGMFKSERKIAFGLICVWTIVLILTVKYILMVRIFLFLGISFLILGALSGAALFNKAVIAKDKKTEGTDYGTLWGLFILCTVGGLILILIYRLFIIAPYQH